jgi:hypothetical protein
MLRKDALKDWGKIVSASLAAYLFLHIMMMTLVLNA